MINIFSNSADTSIDFVLDWLEYYQVPYKRHNPNTFFSNYPTLSLAKSNWENELFWYYKWNNDQKQKGLMGNTILDKGIQKKMVKEKEILFSIYWKNLPIKNTINHPDDANVDKYTQLIQAKDIGLNISNTILTCKKIDVLNFCKENKEIVTKNFNSGFFIHSENDTFCNYTTILKETDIQNLPDTFFISLFQEKIEKQFELKIIYIDGVFYPVALLPENKDTDIRRFKNNMTFPHEIPSDLSSKLRLFMDKLNLSYGTIDMIFNKNNEYIFLEVNPSGQFLGYSNLCNYGIEEKIAIFLKKRLNELNYEKK